jgi:hypothetical protein
MKLHQVIEAARPTAEKPMTQCTDRDLTGLLGKGKLNAMARHPWFQQYRNYERAYKHGVSKAGFTEVEVYFYFSGIHKTETGKIRPELMLKFTFSYSGTKVIQVSKYHRDKAPNDMEQKYGPSAGWKHLTDWAKTEDAVEAAWDKHWKDKDNVKEGGWDTTATQSTVVTPAVVKRALVVAQKFITDFNQWLTNNGHEEQARVGHPLGSSAYHDVDAEDKVYGDIDLQIVVPDMEGTHSSMQGQWNKWQDQFLQDTQPEYVLMDVGESKPGHPICKIGPDQYVQIDFIWHIERNAEWGRYRATPERGLKGLLNGNMFSVLGSLLDMSIQHAGVQLKVSAEGKQVSFATRKDTTLKTISSSPTTFILDILYYVADQSGLDRKQVKVASQLKSHPGVQTSEVKVQVLAQGIQGLAQSFELNRLYGKGILSAYDSIASFLHSFTDAYSTKVKNEIASAKRDKASTPEAIARADHDRQVIQQGLDTVLSYFQ